MRRLPLGFLAASLLLTACNKADHIELDTGLLRLTGRGKAATLHATPYERNGRPSPDQVCAWSSTDEKVATVAGAHNSATVTSSGPGTAAVRCTIGGVGAEATVVVHVVSRIDVSPPRAELRALDEPSPFPLRVEAFDEQGAAVPIRGASVTCASEEVCRGDARGQLWAVGPGETTARVEVEGAEVTLPVKVVEGRSADARPRPVTGNPMEEIERAVRKREEQEGRKVP
jgi:hypothetical protein